MTIDQAAVSLRTALERIRDVEGWLTDAQARRLWRAGCEVPPGGRIVEIGSFRGRSAILLALAADPSVDIVAVDPHAGSDRGPNEIRPDAERGTADHELFHRNLAAAGVDGRVRHVRLPSQEALSEIGGDPDVVYVDGAHRYRPARDDIRRYGARVRPGGRLLIHDSFNAIGVTLAILRLLAGSNRFRYIGRSGSLAEYRGESLAGVSRAINTGRQLAQLPYFIRMVLVKVSLVTGLRPVARLLGHASPDWPY